ncbi:MAG: hypothetical protein HY722_14220, partial [Planctomycetes bacterium]|nr:hypothetical protein [Planctomycetota bacterium]
MSIRLSSALVSCSVQFVALLGFASAASAGDLIVQGVHAANRTPKPGDTLQLTVHMRNLGVTPSGSFDNAIVWSPDMAIDLGDTTLRSFRENIPAGKTESNRYQVQVPATAIPGVYFVGVILDTGNAYKETREDNNTAFEVVTVQGPAAGPGPGAGGGATPPGAPTVPPARADLVVASVVGPAAAAPGDTVAVRVIVRNAGNADARIFASTIHLSRNATVNAQDPVLGQFAILGLRSGEDATEDVRVTIPAATAAGAYTIGVRVDTQATVTESDETNNTGVDTKQVAVGAGAVAPALPPA